MVKTKIIALPFAGGNQYSFKPIEAYMLRDMPWVTLELPGRGDRFGEPLLESISEMVDDLIEQIIPHVSDGCDYVIYGHSMGTLLGYELTKKILEVGLNAPQTLVFTGSAAPGRKSKEKRSQLPEALFWDRINALGGLPKAILDHKELRELYYPILKADFKAIENYNYEPMDRPFSIPMTICMGKDEIGNETGKCTIEDVNAWAEETHVPCEPQYLEGGHFFILDDPQAVFKLLCQSVLV